MDKKYSIGLDIGVTSVGWAVIGEDNQLLRYKKKNMWGSRLFDEANKAADRRVNRSARRRLKRRAQRINFLQQLLTPMVLAVDDGFFIKLNESMLHDDDKKLSPLSESLRAAGYLEDTKASPKKYPTIYHLRKALMESNEKFDPRLVYLAIHHIIKYRGNFLYQGQKFNIEDTQSVADNLSQIFEYMESELGFDASELESKKSQIINILKNSSLSRSVQRSEVQELFGFKGDQKTCLANILGAFLGFKINLQKIFTDLDKTDLEFSKFEEKRDEIAENLGERIEFLDLLQSVHSWVVLQNVLSSEASISQAMINKYDAYAEDLKFIKKLFKQYLSKEDYKEYFKSAADDKGEFSHYSKYVESGWNYQDFIKDLKKYLEKAEKAGASLGSPEAKKLLARLENGDAFSKQRTSDNGAIPYQLHKYELEKIIGNQGKYYPELLEKVDNGDGDEKYKLVRLIEHRIPYYVGPLQSANQNNSDFAWMKRSEAGDITPFNFYKKVDKISSAEAFINNLTNNCTYLPDQPVLAKNSLLFSEFTVRNEIKNMRIDGEQVSIEFENKLFSDLFLKKKKVTTKDILNYLKSSHYAALVKNPQPEITGLSNKTSFNSSMSSYIDFTQKIGLELELETSSANYQMVEKLIHWVTIFEDKSILKEKVKLEYGDKLSGEQIEAICRLNYSGWASLSRKLLAEVKSHPRGSEFGQSIIELMRTGQSNFMQIISNESYGIKSKLAAELEEYMATDDKTDYDLVRDLPASPGVKRGIWQSVKLVKEIVELQGGKLPEKIYIEMAKGSDGSGQKVDRKKELNKLYDKIELNTAYVTKEEFKQLKQELVELNKVDRQALALYFRQLGKCAYSGKSIDLGRISQTCQVDHILPQSLIKDDSLDNKVLALSAENQHKRETYPIEPEIVRQQIAMWRNWADNGLISPAKFARLTQTQEKYDKEKSSGGFIARQLVETRQITKHVAALFDRIYKLEDGKSIVEPVKARITSEFRQKFDFPKSRSINDFHHAKDAYLAAVLGRYLAAKFDDRRRSVLYEKYMKFQGENSRQDREKRELGFVLYGIDKKENVDKNTGEITDGEQRIQTIRRTMKFNDCLVTKKAELNENGQLFDATIYKRQNSAKAKIARSQGLSVEKYGGHTSDKMAYMATVELVDKKGKVARKLVKIPLRVALVAKTIGDLEQWLKNEHDAEKAVIIKNKIPKYQIIKTKDDSLLILTSQADAGNFKQLRLSHNVEKRYAHMQNIFSGLDKIDFDDATLARKVYYRLPDLASRSGESGAYLYSFKPEAANEINNFFNRFYEILLGKIKEHIPFYGEKMIKKVEDFYSVFKLSDDVYQKFLFLENMLILTSADARCAAFEKLEMSKKYFNSGTGLMTMKTFYLDDITFYHHSITGLKLKKRKL